MTDDELRRLARRMCDNLRREVEQNHLDVADLFPYLREAAGDRSLQRAFEREALRRGDVGQVLWSLLEPNAQYQAFVSQCRRSAQVEEELRLARANNPHT